MGLFGLEDDQVSEQCGGSNEIKGGWCLSLAAQSELLCG